MEMASVTKVPSKPYRPPKYPCIVARSSGYIPDTAGAIASVSVALGASIIEKHFTLDRSAGGLDDSFPLEPAELASLCQDSNVAWQALGSVNYERKSSETANVNFRRSLYFVKDLSAGEGIDNTANGSVQSGYGIAPKYEHKVVGARVSRNGKSGTAVTWDVVKQS